MATTSVSINQEQLAALDYVFKRDAANVVKTDGFSTQTIISAANEGQSVQKVVRADQIWTESAALLQGPQAAGAPVREMINHPLADLHAIVPDLRGRSWLCI